MKSIFLSLKPIVLVPILAFLFSCKKDENLKQEETTPVPTENTTGNVVVPQGMNIDGWKVNSGFSEADVTQGKYLVASPKEGFSIQYVSDNNDRVMMMGIKYPGQTNFDISAQSTVLAMLLNMPAVLSLTEQGKIDLLNKIKTNSEFNSAVTELENILSTGNDLFDSTATSFHQKLGVLFEQAALKPSGSTENMNILRGGKNLIFQNAGKPFIQVVGIYNGSARIKKLEVDRYKYFISSLTDLASLQNATNPIEQPFTMTNDGSYKIKIRTGSYDYGDVESSEAFKANVSAQVLDAVIEFIGDLPFASCFTAGFVGIGADVVNAIQSYNNISGIELFRKVFYDVSILTVKRSAELLKNCTNNPGQAGINFIKKTEKFLRYTKIISTAFQFLNQGAFMYQYFSSPAGQDTCFQVNGNNVEVCNQCDGSTTISDIDGNEYHVVKIGTQCWMKENLKVSRYRDGSAIPTGLSNTSWENTTSGAYAIYSNNSANDATYGKLYNWYSVVDARGLCPAGWHVPTNGEWTILENFLGGTSVAGGAMKAVSSLWNSPNTGATNSSGFTALPGGYRRYFGSFDFIGSGGYWWSSTESSSTYAWYRYLYYTNANSNRFNFFKTNGFSVRCLRD